MRGQSDKGEEDLSDDVMMERDAAGDALCYTALCGDQRAEG